jgi:hypothetical protein
LFTVLNNPLLGCRKQWLRVLLIPLAPFWLSKARLFWLLLIGGLAIFGTLTRSAASGFECHRLLLPFCQRAAIFLGRERPVQRGFEDLERPANLRNQVMLLIEILGNTQLFTAEGFWPAAFSFSGSGSHKTCGCSLPNEVSLKLRKRAKDMGDQFAPTGGGIPISNRFANLSR